MLKIWVSGATGREWVRGVLETDDMTPASAVARQAAGQDVGAALGGAPGDVMVAASLDEALAAPCDVLIDAPTPAPASAWCCATRAR